MVDRSKKMQRSDSENTTSKAASATAAEVSDDSSEGIDVKTCVDCGTSRTPLWRGGPAGPKSLCNACGIKSRKKRRSSVQGLNKVSVEEKRSKRSLSHSIPINRSEDNPKKMAMAMALGNGVTRKRSTVEKLRRKMLGDEEEQAAFLLMALSCGTVYAY